jgi:anti-repressor protein
MNAITPFQFDTTPVRAIERDGEAWFVAADVCAALGLGNTAMAVAKLDVDEKGVSSIDTPGGRQDVIAISEAGLYTLALRCRDAMTPGAPAYRFRKWVTGQVLPAIRRQGHYSAAPDPMKALGDPATLRTMLLGYSERVIELEAVTSAQASEIATLIPQAEALGRIAVAQEGAMSITAAAKALQMGPRDGCAPTAGPIGGPAGTATSPISRSSMRDCSS